jgi:hypothetical protein
MGPFELVLGVVKLLTCIGQSNMGGRITDAACVNLSCITLYRPGPNQWSDPVQFLGGCSRGRPKTIREKKIGNFRLLVTEPPFGHKCPARKFQDCPARRTCIRKSANFYASHSLTGQKICPDNYTRARASRFMDIFVPTGI